MGYNREKAIEYAEKWAEQRNPRYYNFDGQGGDCTNFISQCLYAGIGEMNFTRDVGWYYNSPRDRAAAWSGVEFLHRFLTRNKGTGPRASEKPLETAEIGDIIQLSFDGKSYQHTLLVVAIEPGIQIATHSQNAWNRPLSTYDYQKARLLHIENPCN